MKKLILIIIFIIVISNIKLDEDVVIPDESIRFRIIANSNSIEDQELKMQIVKDLENNYFPMLNYENINTSRINIVDNMELLESRLSHYTNNYKINYGSNYFPSKTYLGVNYQEGNYESIVISLGSATGDNFWCVLFPPLCLLEGTNTNNNEVEYRSLIKDILNKY